MIPFELLCERLERSLRAIELRPPPRFVLAETDKKSLKRFGGRNKQS